MAMITQKIGAIEYLTAEGISVPHGFTTRFGGVSEGSQASLNLDEILFTLSHPVDGTDAGFYWSVIRFSVIPAVCVLFTLIVLQHFLDAKALPDKGKGRLIQALSGWLLPLRCPAESRFPFS